ncbi:MAG: tetratricopeptide repeat protein [Bacteroidetes bacterium]|nr:tetratricopeptide repeat protein [Bacteroidota bacterium]
MKHAVFCFFIFCSSCLYAQGSKHDTAAVLKLLDSAKAYLDSDYDKAQQFAEAAKQQSKKIKYGRGQALAYKMLASVYYNKGEIPQAEEYTLIALEKLRVFGTLSEVSGATNLLGLIYMSQGKYYQAESYFHQLWQMSSSLKDTASMINALHNLGVVNHYKGEFDKTAKFYDQSLRLAERAKDEKRINANLRNLGMLYGSQREHEKEKFYIRKAMHGFKKANDRLSIAYCWQGLGTAHFNMLQFDSSLIAHGNALTIFEDLGKKDGVSQQLCNIADIYVQKEQYGNAKEFYNKSVVLLKQSNEKFGLILAYTGLANTHYAEEHPKIARQYYDSALSTAKEINAAWQMADVYYFLADFEAYNKNYKAAYEALTHYSKGKDTLLSAEKTKLVHELEAQYENEKKQKEIRDKQTEILYLKKTNQMYVWLWALSGFVALLIVLLLFNWIKHIRAKSKRAIEQEQAKKKAVELELEYKKKELTQLALHISNQNEFLESFKNNLKEATDEQQKKSLERELESKLVLDKQREDFEMNINLIHEDFFRKLQEKFPSLTENEKKLCAMLRLNLSSKEIASIQNISAKSVEMNRYRLRQKLQLNSEENLNVFLSSI